jgi:hypothetical protein
MAQNQWRFCTKCNALFFNGFEDGAGPHPKGVCPRDGGAHHAEGFDFDIDFDANVDSPDTPKTQSKWRFCNKCNVMFFQGAPPKDRHCAAGGPHQEQGFHFKLPVNRKGGPVLNPVNDNSQGSWHFCGKCTSLFFNGFSNKQHPGIPDPTLDANKGVCPADRGAHVALGDTFVLNIKRIFFDHPEDGQIPVEE